MEITRTYHNKENIGQGKSFLGETALPESDRTVISLGGNLKGIQTIESPFEGYNPFAVEKNDLRTFPSYPFGDYIEIYGNVLCALEKKSFANCFMEVWHLSPNSSKYNHRARFKSNDLGEYRFITDLPGRRKGENYKIFFKITHGERSFFNKLTFNNIQAYIWGLHSNKKNTSAGQLISNKNNGHANTTAIEFNLRLH